MQIIDALNELFRTKTVEDVSIAMICKQAGISRPTFYRYFTDKYDAINWYHYIYSCQVLYQVGKTLTWYEASLDMFRHVVEERNFYERAYAQNDTYESLMRFGEHTNIEEQLKTLAENGVDVTDELEYQVRFWARSVQVAIVAWVREGFPWTPEEFAHHLEGCRPRQLQEAMDGPVLARRAAAAQAP